MEKFVRVLVWCCPGCSQKIMFLVWFAVRLQLKEFGVGRLVFERPWENVLTEWLRLEAW